MTFEEYLIENPDSTVSDYFYYRKVTERVNTKVEVMPKNPSGEILPDYICAAAPFNKKKLKALRKERNVKLKDLASILDLTYKTIINYSSGHRISVTDEGERKLCKFFNVESDYFRKP